MKHYTTREIAESARLARPECPDWVLRRQRLQRFASLLDATSDTVTLFSTMECYPRKQRLELRHNRSPLAVAFKDPLFRAEGLSGDRVRDGVGFFKLSLGEAHALLCDCRYADIAQIRQPLAKQIAMRARGLADKRTFAEICDILSTRFSSWMSSR